MRKLNLIITLIICTAIFSIAQTWDILDKPMAAYDKDGASATDNVWEVFQAASAGGVIEQKDTYVNFKKTIASSVQPSRWAWVRPKDPIASLMNGQAYSVEVKARVHPAGIADDGKLMEANQISLRLGSKKIATPIYLRCGDGVSGGSVNTAASTLNAFPLNTAIWQVYRLVLHANHRFYDVYVEGVELPVFENVPVVATGDADGVVFGAESYHRCNIDVEYVRMGTGDFYSRSKIGSVVLNSRCHPEGVEKAIAVTVETMVVPDGTNLLVSLVDKDDEEVAPAVETAVAGNKATATLTVPATVPGGEYRVKVAAPDGKIGDVAVRSRTVDYRITSIDFGKKNLVTFGNSITIAADSWAYHLKYNLGFAHLFNGAVSGGRWYKSSARKKDGTTIWTQNYSKDGSFAGMRSNPGSDDTHLQQFINNCAVVHVQRYLMERDKNRYPDYVIFSYGTNDSTSVAVLGDASETLKAEFARLDLSTIAGALRWCVDTLRMEFPATHIYVALPLQAKGSIRNQGNLKKMDVIKAVCDGLGVPYFDCYNESGITQANADQYLSDGLHPNAAGQALHGAYIARKLNEAVASDLPDTKIESVEEVGVAVSSTLLHAGEELRVQSSGSGKSLSEVAFYDLSGKAVSHTNIPAVSAYALPAPATAGAYVMTVRLADRSLRSFKVLVKE